eukprot:3408189-Amphidinium_carterae.2
MELFGGHGGVTTCAVRKKLRVGRNVDLTTGCDVRDEHMRRSLWNYVRTQKPTLIVMSPPCTAFCSWARFNKVLHPEAWRRSMELGA